MDSMVILANQFAWWQVAPLVVVVAITVVDVAYRLHNEPMPAWSQVRKITSTAAGIVLLALILASGFTAGAAEAESE